MQWYVLFLALIPPAAHGQRWAESVIFTQNGPVPYKPIQYPRYGGYYTAEVLPVYPEEALQAGRIIPWQTFGNSFNVPINSGINVAQIPLTNPIKSTSISMKRKKSTLKKNGYYKMPQYDKPSTKLTIPRQKPKLESNHDHRFNEMRNSYKGISGYKGRRLVNRGLKIRQSDKILKGQVIDHNKNHEFENYRPQVRSNRNDVEAQTVGQKRVFYYFNNGHQGPDLSSVQNAKSNQEIKNIGSSSYYTGDPEQ